MGLLINIMPAKLTCFTHSQELAKFASAKYSYETTTKQLEANISGNIPGNF